MVFQVFFNFFQVFYHKPRFFSHVGVSQLSCWAAEFRSRLPPGADQWCAQLPGCTGCVPRRPGKMGILGHVWYISIHIKTYYIYIYIFICVSYIYICIHHMYISIPYIYISFMYNWLLVILVDSFWFLWMIMVFYFRHINMHITYWAILYLDLSENEAPSMYAACQFDKEHAVDGKVCPLVIPCHTHMLGLIMATPSWWNMKQLVCPSISLYI